MAKLVCFVYIGIVIGKILVSCIIWRVNVNNINTLFMSKVGLMDKF